MDPPKLSSDVLELIEKIRLIGDPTMEDRATGIRGARVEVILNDGSREDETVLIPKGDPENPLTRNDILDKLRSCAKGQATEDTLMKLVDRISNIKGDKQFENPIKEVSG